MLPLTARGKTTNLTMKGLSKMNRRGLLVDGGDGGRGNTQTCHQFVDISLFSNCSGFNFAVSVELYYFFRYHYLLPLGVFLAQNSFICIWWQKKNGLT